MKISQPTNVMTVDLNPASGVSYSFYYLFYSFMQEMRKNDMKRETMTKSAKKLKNDAVVSFKLKGSRATYP